MLHDSYIFKKGWLLPSLGCLVGIFLAIMSLLGSAGVVLPEGYVARVNEVLIPEAKYLEVLNALARDRRSALTAKDRLFVLERLIEEELLVQRGQSLGMLQSHQPARAALVRGIQDSIIAGRSSQPSARELHSFYLGHQSLFTPPTHLKLKHIVLPMTADSDRVADLLAAGHSIATVKKQFHVPTYPTAPENPTPASKLLRYLGSTLLQAVLKLKPSEFTRPMISNGYRHIIYLESRTESIAPPFETVRDLVEIKYWKAGDVQRFRGYLNQLKQESLIMRRVL